LPLVARVQSGRFDGAGLHAIADYITNVGIESGPKLVVWAIDDFDIGVDGARHTEFSDPIKVSAYIKETVLAVADELKSRGCKLVLVSHPTPNGFAPGEDTIAKILDNADRIDGGYAHMKEVEGFVTATGIPTIQTIDTFVAKEKTFPAPAFTSPEDQHFVGFGNTYYATLIAQGLQRLKPWR
jgi:hypothetical protein